MVVEHSHTSSAVTKIDEELGYDSLDDYDIPDGVPDEATKMRLRRMRLRPCERWHCTNLEPPPLPKEGDVFHMMSKFESPPPPPPPPKLLPYYPLPPSLQAYNDDGQHDDHILKSLDEQLNQLWIEIEAIQPISLDVDPLLAA